ncbi:MAG: hypothetical protein RRY79_05855 [Clostridia bacterium]
MKKTFFNRKLYANMLKQQRMVGCILLVLSLIFCTFIVFNLAEICNQNKIDETGLDVIFNMSIAGNVLMFYMFVAGICLPFRAFSFLNKRNGSDFYHSLPVSRRSIFISAISSSLTWIVFTMLLIVAFTFLGASIVGAKVVAIDLYLMIFSNLAGALLILMCSALACSLTGTMISNFVLAMLILFLPRFTLTLIYVGVYNLVSIIPNINSMAFLNPNCNYPVAVVFNLLTTFFTGEAGLNSIMYNVTTTIYTFILSIVYFLFGMLAFVKRKSETVDKAISGKLMNHAYRIAISLPPLFLLAYFINNRSGFDAPIAYYILIVLSLLTYFLFELISTKSAKKMLKCAPFYLVSLAVSLAFFFSIKGIAQIELNKTPSAADISAISIVTGNNDDYSSIAVANVRYENEKIKEIASKALSNTVNMVKLNTLYSQNTSLRFPISQPLIFIGKNGDTFMRIVCLSQRDYDVLMSIMTSDERYTNALIELPPDDTVTLKYVFSDNGNTLSKVATEELYNLFKRDFAALSDAEKIAVITECTDEYDTADWGIQVKGEYNHKPYSTRFAILTSMKECTAKYKEICKELDDIAMKSFMAMPSMPLSSNTQDGLNLNFEVLEDSEINNVNLIFDSYIESQPDNMKQDKPEGYISRENANKLLILLKKSVRTDYNSLDGTVNTIKLLNVAYNFAGSDNINNCMTFRNLYLSFDANDYEAFIALVRENFMFKPSARSVE